MGRSGNQNKKLSLTKNNVRQFSFEEVGAFLNRILPNNSSLFLVGGSLRDFAIGDEAKDFDFAVLGISPEDLVAISFPGVTVKELKVADQIIGVRFFSRQLPREGVEVALTRTESSSGPGHKDFNITVGSSIEDDLARRDFTCNAIAARINSAGKITEMIDPFNGLSDAKNSLIRQTHKDAIAEDPLRILRAYVRVAKNNFDIEPETLKSIKENSSKLSPEGPLSSERLEKELRKIFSGVHAKKAVHLLKEADCFSAVFPELSGTVGFFQNSRYHDLTVDRHCEEALDWAAKKGFDEDVVWAAFLHDAGKPASSWLGDDGRLHYYRNPALKKEDHAVIGAQISNKTLSRLKFPNQLREEINFLVKEHMWPDDRGFSDRSETKKGIVARRFINRYGKKRALKLIDLREADNSSKSSDDKRENLNKFKKQVIKEMENPTSREDLSISGADLIAIGASGPEIGEILDTLVERVVVSPEMNEKDRLIDWAVKIKRSLKNPVKNSK